MPRTPEQLSEKFAREWEEAKADAITNYVAISSTLAEKTKNAKAKMIANFTAVMATTKFEDRLEPYIGSQLMGNAYTQAMTAKLAITDAEKLKVKNDIALKRAISENIDDVIVIYKAQDTANEVTVPAGIQDKALKAMLIQGINANQYRISSASTNQQIYDLTKGYMKDTVGWPVGA